MAVILFFLMMLLLEKKRVKYYIFVNKHIYQVSDPKRCTIWKLLLIVLIRHTWPPDISCEQGVRFTVVSTWYYLSRRVVNIIGKYQAYLYVFGKAMSHTRFNENIWQRFIVYSKRQIKTIKFIVPNCVLLCVHRTINQRSVKCNDVENSYMSTMCLKMERC